jgi:hypothetical protein
MLRLYRGGPLQEHYKRDSLDVATRSLGFAT